MRQHAQRGFALRAIWCSLLVLLVLTQGALPHPVSAQADLSPEQQLVEKFAPHIVLRKQAHACDPNGEPYIPLPIEAVLNDPRVMLRQNTGKHDASFDAIVAYGPSMEDIAGRGEDYYLDFPGNPLEPACLYEQWSREKEQKFPTTIYARIATMDDHRAMPALEGTPGLENLEEPIEPLLHLGRDQSDIPDGLVIQYWFFYLFNDFNNKHEGDWEMIQLSFDAHTVEEALNSSPVLITAAQHGGGERTTWGDDVAVVGQNPVVYSAAGSHATHFDSRLFVGWGKNGTGFGCDNTNGPGTTTIPKVVLIPRDYETNPAFGWLQFGGRWGEKQPWEFNGPRGPQLGTKWNQPVTWIATVRENSIYIPDSTGLGPMPGKFFCGLADVGSMALIQFTLHPWWTSFGIVAVIAGAVGLFSVIRRSLVKATRVYFRYRGSVASIAVVLIPLGFAVTALQQALTAVPPFSWVIYFIGTSEAARLGAALAVGGLLTVVEALVVAPAIIATMEQIRNNQQTHAATAWRSVRNRFPRILAAWLSISVRIFLQAISVVGIPWAIRNSVRWTFFAQAVMIDDVHEPKMVRNRSAEVVKGHWLNVMAHSVVLSLLTILPGPIIGVVLMVAFSQGIEFVNVLSSVVYAYVMPFKAIAMTLLYYRYSGRTEEFLEAFATPDAGPAEVEEPLASAPVATGD